MTEIGIHIGAGPEDRVRAIVDEVIKGTPLYVVDLYVKGGKGSRVVEIFIESDEALDVEGLARVSRQVAFVLDAEDVLQGAYSLNVSSPGADRPFKLPRQFKKNVGRMLKVEVKDATTGSTASLAGKLVRADEVEIELAPAKGDPMVVAVEDILEAKVQLPW